MPIPTLPPGPADLERLIIKVERLERQFRALDLPPADDSLTNRPPLVFSYPGALETDVESPPWYPRSAISFSTIRVSQLTAGAEDLVIDVNVAGSTVATVTLDAGDVTVLDNDQPFEVAAGQRVTVTVNDAGDAENASVELLV